MHDHPNREAELAGTATNGRTQYFQRIVLLELVTNPPAEGDDVDEMAARFREPRHEVDTAVDALVEVGLATRRGKMVRASAAAWRFESLWPTV